MSLNDDERLKKISEQIEEIKAEKDKKIKQLKAQERAILTRQKERERKARTRRLIQIGATIEKCNIKTLEQANAIVKLYENDTLFKKKIDDCLSNLSNQKSTQETINITQTNITSNVRKSILDD